MRLTTLALVALLAAACGGDDADDAPAEQPAPRQPAADTTIGDTTPPTGATPDAADGAGAGTGAGGEAGATGREGGAREAGAPGADGGQAAARLAEGERLYTIQVAAFTDPATAEEWTERLRGQGLPVWTSVAEPGGRTFYRVRAGAVPTVSEARRLGAIISDRYDWPVWVAPMSAADRPPRDAIEASRRLLEGG